jgi:hypothetical protein
MILGSMLLSSLCSGAGDDGLEKSFRFYPVQLQDGNSFRAAWIQIPKDKTNKLIGVHANRPGLTENPLLNLTRPVYVYHWHYTTGITVTEQSGTLLISFPEKSYSPGARESLPRTLTIKPLTLTTKYMKPLDKIRAFRHETGKPNSKSSTRFKGHIQAINDNMVNVTFDDGGFQTIPATWVTPFETLQQALKGLSDVKFTVISDPLSAEGYAFRDAIQRSPKPPTRRGSRARASGSTPVADSQSLRRGRGGAKKESKVKPPTTPPARKGSASRGDDKPRKKAATGWGIFGRAYRYLVGKNSKAPENELAPINRL